MEFLEDRDLIHCSVLRTVAFLSPHAMPAELSRLTGIPFSNVVEILEALADGSLVNQNPDGNSWRIADSADAVSAACRAETITQDYYIKRQAEFVETRISSRLSWLDDTLSMIEHAKRSRRENI